MHPLQEPDGDSAIEAMDPLSPLTFRCLPVASEIDEAGMRIGGKPASLQPFRRHCPRFDVIGNSRRTWHFDVPSD